MRLCSVVQRMQIPASKHVGVLVPALRQKIARMRNEVFDLSGAAHGATTTSNS